MFIQVIQGRCTRQDELRALADRWLEDLAPGATGWLGGTYGFTDDDQFIGVVRFESREAAAANSARPEQGRWAEEMMRLVEDVEFHDCDDVTVMMDGGSDEAGFVQVIRGRVEDPSGLKSLMADTDLLHQARPEIIGATLAIEADGTFIETVAFSDEAAARDGERRGVPDMPDEVRSTIERAMAGSTFYDLHRPWFASA